MIFFLKYLHTERQNTFIPLERLAGSGSNSPPRLKFYFRERATVKFPWVSRGGRWSAHDIWSMASWKLVATPSFHELSTYVYHFLLVSVRFLNFFSTALWQLKKLPIFWWKKKHGWNVNTLTHVWCLIFHLLEQSLWQSGYNHWSWNKKWIKIVKVHQWIQTSSF